MTWTRWRQKWRHDLGAAGEPDTYGAAYVALAELLSVPLVTADAATVALAELLSVPLVTADRRLASAPGLRCDIEVLSP